MEDDFGDLHLRYGSQAIDSSENSVCPSADLDGTPRPVDDICDMGAYEYINRSHIAVDDDGAGFSTDEDTPFITGSVLTNDNDPNGDAFSLQSFDQSGMKGWVSDNGDGTFSYDPNDQFENLSHGETATDSFT